MIFKHLRTFVTIVEQGSVSKAAVQLRIAQPALSRHISELERELGLKLFDRVARRLLLTGEGAQLLGNCRSLLGYVSSLGEQARRLRSGDQGVLTVAASPGQIETVLSMFLHRYAQRYPKVEVKLIEAVGDKTLDMLDRGEIQIGITTVQAEQIEDRGFGSYAAPPLQLLAAWHPKFRLDYGAAIEIGRLAAPSFATAGLRLLRSQDLRRGLPSRRTQADHPDRKPSAAHLAGARRGGTRSGHTSVGRANSSVQATHQPHRLRAQSAVDPSCNRVG